MQRVAGIQPPFEWTLTQLGNFWRVYPLISWTMNRKPGVVFTNKWLLVSPLEVTEGPSSLPSWPGWLGWPLRDWSLPPHSEPRFLKSLNPVFWIVIDKVMPLLLSRHFITFAWTSCRNGSVECMVRLQLGLHSSINPRKYPWVVPTTKSSNFFSLFVIS